MNEAKAVLEFWQEAGPKKWFVKDDGFDKAIWTRFGELHKRACKGALAHWQGEAENALALILVLDQFSRNMFRNDARAFTQDAMGLKTAKASIATGFDQAVLPSLRQFFYMPLMHSESIIDQQACVHLFHELGQPEGLKFAILHRDIIARFGRFPHRNKVLKRKTTPLEERFLDEGGFSG